MAVALVVLPHVAGPSILTLLATAATTEGTAQRPGAWGQRGGGHVPGEPATHTHGTGLMEPNGTLCVCVCVVCGV